MTPATAPEQARRTLSNEIRAAVKAATRHAVHPADEFEGDHARIAGWDPEETRSNAALLRLGTAHLAGLGWQIFPEATDSEDASALVIKRGLATGRLYAANRSLTFTGTLDTPNT
ncbi:hypothetical protein J7F03_30520 [Streptomyces sp. ISL-43]|uniref:hypothetical protein n=1 Tax=Streptomyces sp. ISL-43 TaxID=2819183 RepID=UPI001BED061D|nr:hypothetical protein [Streptomyces sp. ISL-43]MBT2451329.1 hypothetical protein [Streptomyces sp. ISL-43]